MKNLICTLLLIFLNYIAFAQKESCGEELYKKHLTENPELKLLHDNLKYQYLISMDKGELGGGRPEEIEIRIPVVFHIIHKTADAIGQGSNVTKALIDKQLAILNQGFAGQLKKNVPNSNIVFCLAKVNPYFFPTSGIVRVATNENFYPTSDDDMVINVDKRLKKASPTWKPTEYLNIWVTDFGGKPKGYSSFPPTGVYGINNYPFSTSRPGGGDGIVIDVRYFGDGEAILNRGRTLIHEVGHYLGLWHTWNLQPEQRSSCTESNCTYFGDEVCDTPPTDTERFYHPAQCDSALTCKGSAFTKKIISAQNFMGYNDNDNCVTHFTEGQIRRMWLYIKNARTAFWPAAGGRTEDCVCKSCLPASPKIKGDSLSCEGDINTYKVDAATPYGCAITWSVVGGSFIDYNNTVAPVTLPFGFANFTDSIRVKWNNSSSQPRISCVLTNCENIDNVSFQTVVKDVIMKPFKPIAFFQSPIEIGCTTTEFSVRVDAAGISRFQWQLPAGMTLTNAVPNSTNITDVPEAQIRCTSGSIIGEIKVKPLSTACNQDYISNSIVRQSGSPTMPNDTKVFCKTAGKDKVLLSILGDYADAISYIWTLPSGFINLGADGLGNNLGAKQVWVQVLPSASDGNHIVWVQAVTACGSSYSGAQNIWVGLPVNCSIIQDLSLSPCYEYQSYAIVYNNGALPTGWDVTWVLSNMRHYNNDSEIIVNSPKCTSILSTSDNTVLLMIKKDCRATLKAIISNECGEQTWQITVSRGDCMYEDPNPMEAALQSLVKDTLSSAKTTIENINYQAWLAKPSYVAGEKITANLFYAQLQSKLKPIAYLVDENGALASPIDTLRNLSKSSNIAICQVQLPIYQRLASGNYFVKIVIAKNVILLPVTILANPNIYVSSARKEIAENTSANPKTNTEIRAVENPKHIVLQANMPNPFAETTTIRYFLPQNLHGFLVIRNVLGIEMYRTEVIANAETSQELILQTANWQSGIYFCSLYANGEIATQKMVLIK